MASKNSKNDVPLSDSSSRLMRVQSVVEESINPDYEDTNRPRASDGKLVDHAIADFDVHGCVI